MTLYELLVDFAEWLGVPHEGVTSGVLYLRCRDRITELKSQARRTA